MANVIIRFRALTRGLPIINTAKIVREIADAERQHAEKIIAALRVEPPELDGQRYVRTHKLKNSWRVDRTPSISSSGVVTRFRNDVVDPRGKRYASLVQGIDQRPIHQDRWLRADDAELLDRAGFRRSVKEVLRRNGLT